MILVTVDFTKIDRFGREVAPVSMYAEREYDLVHVEESMNDRDTKPPQGFPEYGSELVAIPASLSAVVNSPTVENILKWKCCQLAFMEIEAGRTYNPGYPE